MIERLASSFSGIAALVLPPLIAVALSLAVLTSIHALAGTPEILATIALPPSVTAIYSTIYTSALWRIRRASDGDRQQTAARQPPDRLGRAR